MSISNTITIPIEDVSNALSDKINELMKNPKLPELKDMVDAMIWFFDAYKVEGVSTEFNDEDRLTFSYGVFNWEEDDNNENFAIDLIRVLATESTEITLKTTQLHLLLNYNDEHLKKIEPDSRWSEDYDLMEEFSQAIFNTEGFKLASNKNFVSYNIFVIKEEYP